MASFSAVNTSLVATPVSDQTGQAPTPTTPRPTVAMLDVADSSDQQQNGEKSNPNTPTRHSFGGVPGQRALPDEPITPAQPKEQAQDSDASLKRNSAHLVGKVQEQSQDVEMGEGDEDRAEDDGSDNESLTSESRPNKKKKGQRFFCTEFPPCQLSFTRSEHLARHIRKHTGERPFQCHCSRRFSRLDNLRQHAQTVHVNEEIPGDSLAATSTRFQRQIRTDRVRPPNSRSRASTMSSQNGHTHSRGHSRNLSASSMTSMASSVGIPEETRRRPQPLAMANDSTARARLSLDTYNNMAGGSSQQFMYYNQSPSGYSTPTSTTFSTGGQSPRYQSGMASPASTISRSSYYNGPRSHGRRLSVPSSQNPFQNQNSPYSGAYYSPLPSGQSATFSQNSSVLASPTSSVFSHSRRESETEMEYRRRTWHPSTNSQYMQRPATSGLTYHQTPDEPRPAFTQQQAASQMTRLPGIESFDHAPPPGVRQQSSPMMVDASPRPPSSSGQQSDTGLQQGLTQLDITAANTPTENQWQINTLQQPVYFGHQAASSHPQYVQLKHMSMPEQPVTPRKIKRNAWYGGPLTPSHNHSGSFASLRPSPEDSGSSDGAPTPSTSQGADYNPVIVNPSSNADYPPGTAITDEQKIYNYAPGHQPRTDSGYQNFVSQPQHTYALQSGHDPQFAQSNHHATPKNDMTKLEALVAVATSEGTRAVEHRS